MALITILDELKKLSKKIKGSESKATNTAEAIAEIADAYSSGGGTGGATIESANLYPDSNNVIKSGEITLSDGSFVDITLSYIPEFTVTSKAGTEAGSTSLTPANVLGFGNSYCYAVDRTPSKPAIDEDVSSFTSWDGTSDITVDDGTMITLVECNADHKAVKVGTVVAIINQ